MGALCTGTRKYGIHGMSVPCPARESEVMKIKQWVVDTVHFPSRTAQLTVGNCHFEPHDWPLMQLVVTPREALWSERRYAYVQPEFEFTILALSRHEGVTFRPVLSVESRRRLNRYFYLEPRERQWHLAGEEGDGSLTTIHPDSELVLWSDASTALRLGNPGRLLIS